MRGITLIMLVALTCLSPLAQGDTFTLKKRLDDLVDQVRASDTVPAKQRLILDFSQKLHKEIEKLKKDKPDDPDLIDLLAAEIEFKPLFDLCKGQPSKSACQDASDDLRFMERLASTDQPLQGSLADSGLKLTEMLCSKSE